MTTLGTIRVKKELTKINDLMLEQLGVGIEEGKKYFIQNKSDNLVLFWENDTLPNSEKDMIFCKPDRIAKYQKGAYDLFVETQDYNSKETLLTIWSKE